MARIASSRERAARYLRESGEPERGLLWDNYTCVPVSSGKSGTPEAGRTSGMIRQKSVCHAPFCFGVGRPHWCLKSGMFFASYLASLQRRRKSRGEPRHGPSIAPGPPLPRGVASETPAGVRLPCATPFRAAAGNGSLRVFHQRAADGFVCVARTSPSPGQHRGVEACAPLLQRVGDVRGSESSRARGLRGLVLPAYARADALLSDPA
jgi:hypothetical protein